MVISLHFDGHFSWWTRVSRNQKVSFLDFIGAKGDRSYSNNWSCKTCKAPVRMSPPTNLHPVFYRQSMVIKNSKHTDQTKQDAVVYDQNGWIRAKSGRFSWKLEESVCVCASIHSLHHSHGCPWHLPGSWTGSCCNSCKPTWQCRDVGWLVGFNGTFNTNRFYRANAKV